MFLFFFFFFFGDKKSIASNSSTSFVSWLLNFDLPRYGSDLRTRYTIHTEAVVDSFGSCFVWEWGVWRTERLRETIQINYKMNFFWTSFQRFSQHFKSISYWRFLGVYIYFTTPQNMQISEYICKFFFEELAIFLKFLWKIIAACNVSKMLLFHRYFLSSFKYMQHQKTFDPFQSSSSLIKFKPAFLIDTPNKRCRFSTQ